MSQAYEFLKECGSFFVLTINGDYPAGNDKENDILSVMIRGKSPCFRNEGAGLVISKRPISPKG